MHSVTETSTGIFTRRTIAAFSVEAVTSISANLLLQGFFFYATGVFHWSREQSFTLAAGEGIVYILGALAANLLAARFGRRRSLMLLQSIMLALTTASALCPTPKIVFAVLLGYSMTSAAQWPNLEGLVSSGVDAHLLSRRIGVYNLFWSGTNALTTAAVGTLIVHLGGGLFWIPVLLHASAMAILLAVRLPAEAPSGHPEPPPALKRQRRLAMQLSRIALPSTYTVLYALIPMLPTLPVVLSFGPEMQTVVASVWMVARFLAFLILGATVWWHTRPRLLLLAAVVMLAGYLGVVLRPADFAGHSASPVTALDQWSMILSQIVLGFSLGLIYAGSLYFGMALSSGSVEHGGYHEALIGLGQVIGPGAGVLAEQFASGNPTAVVASVGGVITLSIVAAAGVTIRDGFSAHTQ